MDDRLPNIDETAVAAFLHDIGKVEQRAAPDPSQLPASSRGLIETILPVYDGRHSHWHALFTDAFFEWAMNEKAWPPREAIDLHRVRQLAIYHHKPDTHRFPWTQLIAEADRLSSGLDRKARDMEAERDTSRQAYRRTPLLSVVTTLRLDAGRKGDGVALPLAELEPGSLFPTSDLDPKTLPDGYVRLRDGFRRSFVELAGQHRGHVELFHTGLISASERWLWAVPSSTMDQPDVGLHDHALSTAAIASCLHAYHAADGSLDDVARIADRDVAKFRLLEGDLSGIQASLFRLARQQVRGGARVLRARSFLMGAMLDAATLLLRRQLGLPAYVVLQAAGGKFQMLVPNLPVVEAVVEELRHAFDAWLVERYAGDLALNLALGPAFPASGFAKAAWPKTLAALRDVAETAKQQPLATVFDRAVLGGSYEAGADGACPTCGVRPRRADLADGGVARCVACHAEHRFGRRLPELRGSLWQEVDAAGDDDGVTLFDRLRVLVANDAPRPAPRLVAAWQAQSDQPHPWPPASRFIANYVPRFAPGEWDDHRYDPANEAMRSVEDIDALREDAIKTFHHLACEDRERVAERWVGRPLLAVLKADVDRLGQLFTRGLGSDRTVGRVVALSRQIDAFFTGWLTHHVKTQTPNVYTVYAGGDDLLVIGPWLTTIRLAADLQQAFHRFAAGNPDVTLSAGIELADPKEPLVRIVERAERRLEAAKQAGRNRVSLVLANDGAIGWDQLDWALGQADWLNGELRGGAPLATGFVYKLLWFADQKARADAGDTNAAGWTALYRYHLARAATERKLRGPEREAFEQRFHLLLGATGEPKPARIPITLALYRNR